MTTEGARMRLREAADLIREVRDAMDDGTLPVNVDGDKLDDAAGIVNGVRDAIVEADNERRGGRVGLPWWRR